MKKKNEETISGIPVQIEEYESGMTYIKMRKEKKGPRSPSIDYRKIRNASMRNVVGAISWIKKELGSTPISLCSFQVVCAFVAKYLGTYKKDYLINSRYCMTKKYPQRVYDLAKAVYILSHDFKF